MGDDIVKRLREQERILGAMQYNLLGWMDDVLREAFSPEAFLRYAASMGINLPQEPNVAGHSNEQDAYKLLGLEKTASDVEVKSRYRELLKKLHPDTAGIKGTECLLMMIIAAYQQIARERRWSE